MSATPFAGCGRGVSTCPAASRLSGKTANDAEASRMRRRSPHSSERFKMQMYDLPDARGHFGPYGGVFVAETLTHALDELRDAYERARADAAFQAEFHYELT